MILQTTPKSDFSFSAKDDSKNSTSESKLVPVSSHNNVLFVWFGIAPGLSNDPFQAPNHSRPSSRTGLAQCQDYRSIKM